MAAALLLTVLTATRTGAQAYPGGGNTPPGNGGPGGAGAEVLGGAQVPAGSSGAGGSGALALTGSTLVWMAVLAILLLAAGYLLRRAVRLRA